MFWYFRKFGNGIEQNYLNYTLNHNKKRNYISEIN